MNNEKIMKNLCNERDEKGRAKIQKIMNYAKQEMTEKNLEKTFSYNNQTIKIPLATS